MLVLLMLLVCFGVVVGVSSDPAEEAAKRACGPHRVSPYVGPGRYAMRGAREALAPLRELHRHGECPENDLCELPDHLSLCVTCCRPWPCATAKLVYPAEELT